MKALLLLFVVVYCLFCVDSLQANQIGFDEEFSLARDRSVPLKQLIPGTEDYYYYHCLFHQQRGEYAEVEKLLTQWIKRYSHTSRAEEILTRQAILQYGNDKKKTVDFIVSRLNLRFQHEKKQAASQRSYPSRFPSEMFSFEFLKNSALRDYRDLSGFETMAFEKLKKETMDPDRRRDLLKRMVRPDCEDLAQMVVSDLQHRHSGGFGSLSIHEKLLPEQLEACTRIMPKLLDDTRFVNAYLKKLHPGADDLWENNPAQKLAFLERMLAFAQRLKPVFNSLKAHLIYHILDVKRNMGNYDRELFLQYLQFPRSISYINDNLLKNLDSRFRVDLHANYRSHTLFPAIGDDEKLVRDFLQKLLIDEKDASAYSGLIESDYLKYLLAETKILNGIGDMEQWFSLLPAGYVQELKDRIELELMPDNKTVYQKDDKIDLHVRIKNVKKLIVKTYKINLYNYYRTNLNDITTAIDLDGLVANDEKVIEYSLPDYRRHQQRFAFDNLSDDGVYIVEFIGNGMSSRALIRRGQLAYVQRPGAAGHLFTIFNDRQQQVKDAVILMNNQEYKPDATGVINIPYSSSPGKRQIIIKQGDFAAMHSFNHEAERYNLTGALFVDREALIAGKNASLIFRPALFVNDCPIDVKILKEVSLTISSTDIEGTDATREISDFKIYNDQESVFEFKVPEKLSQIRFSVKAKVENLSLGKEEELSVSTSHAINGIDKTDKTMAFYLRRDGQKYIAELLGKTGEPCSAIPVNIDVKHRMIKRSLSLTLQTDKIGRIYLGELDGISNISLSGPEDTTYSFAPRDRKNNIADLICGSISHQIMIPVTSDEDQKIEDICALYEMRSGTYFKDWRKNVTLKNHCLNISDLPAGDFELFLKDSQQTVAIKITDGKVLGSYCVSAKRALPIIAATPTQIANVKTVEAGKSIQIRLVNARPSARIHVIAGRFMPEFGLFEEFSSIEAPVLSLMSFEEPLSRYLSGRNIGDEYRYILERKYAKIFPGNMLRRPSLLLNPWSLRKTDTQTRDAASGDAWAGSAPQEMSRSSSGRARSKPMASAQPSSGFSGLDFLPDTSVMLANLKPDKNGVVDIDLEKTGDLHNFQIIVVDRYDLAYAYFSLPEKPGKMLDLRMNRTLDVKKHFSQQKNISVLKKAEELEINDVSTARMEIYDNLSAVYKLFSAINPDQKLIEFSFVSRWPDLNEAKKLELYSKHACHELHFFLYHHDLTFFNKVIMPFLAHKRDKTFLDKWLLNTDLKEYLEPWAFNRLNIVEKILLGKRLSSEGERLARHVNDLFDLLPEDRDLFNQLFLKAISGNSLETEGKGNFSDFKAQAAKPQFLNESAEGFRGDFGAVPPSPVPMVVARSARPAMAKKAKMMADFDDMEKEESFMAADEAFAEPSMELDAGRRREVRQLFRQVDKTEEWVENNYYKLPIEQQTDSLIKVNPFWNDFALHQAGKPFVSANVAYATGNFSEMMLALAVLDLPFKAEQHQTDFDGVGVKLKASGNLIVFHEEIKPAAESEQNAFILTGQNFFARNDRYRYEKNEKVDKFITDEFQTRVVYGCQVVVTNPTSSRQKIDVLMQIPDGAMPVLVGHYTRSTHLQLEGFSTKTLEYFFYFPKSGNFKHYPVHVSDGSVMLASTKPFVFKVVDELTNYDKTSWPWVSQNSNDDEVLEFLAHNNVERLDLEMIAFRMKNKTFFESCYNLLKKRQVYNDTLWSYGLMHFNQQAIREFLEHSALAQKCGSSFTSDLLEINPVARHLYQHKEYWPLVNARVYPLGKKREILNDQFFGQYQALMVDLRYRRSLSDHDRMAVVYYLLLQDRIAEADEMFGQIKDQEILSSIQYGYIKAYLNFSSGDIDTATMIAAKYKDYPVIRWRNLFADVMAQADEVKGKAPSLTDDRDREQQQRLLAASQPDFELAVENRMVTIRHRNLKNVTVNFYLMDIELLFSRRPFVQEVSGQFSIISPNHSMQLALSAAVGEHKLELPAQYRDQNVMIEVTAEGLTRSAAYYPNSLALSLVEAYGQIQLSRQKDNSPISKAYVKVYARMKGGEVSFYKDGYTDLRGKFDYASLSTSKLDNVERFAILIMSDEHGSVIREAAPPAR